MKHPSQAFASVLIVTLLAFAGSARAEIIGIEPFAYSDGPIAGQSGGTFWDFQNTNGVHTGTASDWNNISAAPSVISGRLVTDNNSALREYNGPGEGLPPSDEANGAVNDVNVHKVIYYRVTLTTGATLPDFFGLSSYDFGNERIFFGKRSGQANFGLEISGGASTNSTVTVQPNTNYTLVVKIAYFGDTISLFINPDLNAGEPAAHVFRSFPNTEWSTAIRLGSGFTGDPIIWDNLVVATTWEDLGTVVTTTADNDDGSLNPALGGGVSLREAVTHSPSGTLVTFAPALSGQTITLTGGELVVPGTLTVDASALPSGVTIDGNGASRLFRVDANRTLTLKSLNFTGGNAGGGSGGAIANFGGALQVRDCTFADNQAFHGGAIHTQAGSPRFTQIFNSTFARNTATGGNGGAIRNLDGTLNLFASTVSGNTAPAGSGGGLATEGIAPTFTTVFSSIISGNTGDDVIFTDAATTVTSFGNNLIGTGNATNRFNQTRDQTGLTNPKLSPLGYFGGPTMTMHPLIGSPAIDAAGVTNPGGTDQRGLPRFVDGDSDSLDAQLDIGAVEAGILFRVATNGDAAGTTLRLLVGLLNNPNEAARIGFEPDVFPATITLNGTEISAPTTTRLFIDASDLTGPVTISGNNASRVFNIAAGASVAMHSLSIVNGKAPDAANGSGGDGGQGGGIQNHGALSLLSCGVSANRSGRGGNVNSGSNPGGSGGGGGGIFSDGRLSLVSSAVFGNQTGNGGNGTEGLGGEGGSGGGVANAGPLMVHSSSITGNQTGSGGHSAFIGDGVGGSGGGIHHSGGSTALLQATTVSGNVASDVGGGIDSLNAPLKLIHCTVSGNSGAAIGGLNVRQARLEHTTVSGNHTPDFGGGVAYRAVGAAYLELKNSIIAGNTAGSFGPDILITGFGVPDITTIAANLIGNPADAGTFNGPAPLTGDAKLMPLGNYGGPTQTMPPLAGSPAIDAGAASSIFATDQRGFSRVVDGNNSGSAQLDLGAVEAAFRFVTTTNDSGGGSLRQTLAEAAAASGFDAIAFASSLNGGTLSLSFSADDSALTVSDADGVSIDASSLSNGLTLTKVAGNFRLFRVNAGGRLFLTRLTLTGGSLGAGLDGGALFNAGLTVLDRCTLTGNTADFGGAIANDSGSDFVNRGTTLRHCTLTANHATGQFGSAIYNALGRVTLAHCTVTGNTAASGLAGLSSPGSGSVRTEVENSIVAGNAGSDVALAFGNVNKFVSLGHNLIGVGNATNAFNQTGDIVGVADPLLMPLGNHGGPIRTMPPKVGSLAIDAGSAPGISHDQRGFPRSRDNSGDGIAQPDIGAAEAAFLLIATVADSGVGSLREAITLANANGNALDDIFFDPALFGTPRTIDLATALPEVATSVSIHGPGANLLTVRRALNAAAQFRIFTIPEGVANGVAISGITIAGGRATFAGAIFCRSPLTLSNVHVLNNHAGLLAGGIALHANGTFTGCTFSGNTTDGNGGGILHQAEGGSITLRLVNNTVSGNQAGQGGGGIANGCFFGTSRLEVIDSTIAHNNSGGNPGGGILTFTAGSTATTMLRNSIIASNTANNLAVSGGGAATFQTEGFNLASDGGGGFLNVAMGDQTNQNPRLAPLDNYGGPTPTMALRTGSPARNAAPDSIATSDQRGFPIVGVPDIGAYEAGTLTNYNAFIWETLPSTATAAQHAATFDFDGDGANNEGEYVAGTIVTDAQSLFRVTNTTFSNGIVSITFPSVIGRKYFLETSPDLQTWTLEPAFLVGDGNPLGFNFLLPGNPPRYFLRPRVTLP